MWHRKLACTAFPQSMPLLPLSRYKPVSSCEMYSSQWLKCKFPSLTWIGVLLLHKTTTQLHWHPEPGAVKWVNLYVKRHDESLPMEEIKHLASLWSPAKSRDGDVILAAILLSLFYLNYWQHWSAIADEKKKKIIDLYLKLLFVYDTQFFSKFNVI